MSGAHAVYPGTFDPFTAGHADVVDRVRHLFERVTVLVAVNGDKQPAATLDQRLQALRDVRPASSSAASEIRPTCGTSLSWPR